MSYSNTDYRRKQVRYRRRAFWTTVGIVFAIGLLIGLIAGVAIKTNAIDVTSVDEAPSSVVSPTSQPTIIPAPTTGDEDVTEVNTEQGTTDDPEILKEPVYTSLGTFKLTAYCPCTKCCGKWGRNRPTDKDGNPIVYTASGKIAEEGITIAADKTLLSFGTKVYINGHEYEVQDVGGSIKENRIDVYFESHQEALMFGVQYAEVFVIREEE